MPTEKAIKGGRPLEIDRNGLLDAAEKLFSEHGFEGATLRALAKEADCNPALICYHFTGKEGLYQELILRYFGQMRARSEKPAPSPEELLEDWPELPTDEQRAFCAFLHELADSMTSNPRMQKIIYRELMTGGTQLTAAIAKSENGAFQILSERLQELKNAGILAHDCDIRFIVLTLISALVYTMIASPILKSIYAFKSTDPAYLRNLSLYQTRTLFQAWGIPRPNASSTTHSRISMASP